jgi:hypothetical protein
MASNKVWENRLRRQAQRLGLQLQHSRAKRVHIDDHGEYRLIDPRNNTLVAGERFDWSLQDIQTYLDKYEASLMEPVTTEERD